MAPPLATSGVAAAAGTRRGGGPSLRSPSTGVSSSSSSGAPALVLEFGAAFVRVGYAGEPSPRAALSSRLPFPRPASPVDGDDDGNFDDDDEERNSSGGGRPLSIAEWTSMLHPLLSRIYSSILLVRRPDRHRVLILEPFVSPDPFRKALIDILIERCGAPAVLFVPGGGLVTVPCALGGVGKAMMVIDVGRCEGRVAVVASEGGVGRCLVDTFQAVPCGRNDLVRSVVRHHNKTIRSSSKGESKIIGTLLRTMEDGEAAISACLGRRNDESPVRCALPSTGRTVDVDPELIERCLDELYFNPFDPVSLVHAVLLSLLRCPVDLRVDAVSNIAIVGGGSAAVPGFGMNLGRAIRTAFSEGGGYDKRETAVPPRFQPLRAAVSKAGGPGVLDLMPLATPDVFPWVGGSIVGTLPMADEQWVVARRRTTPAVGRAAEMAFEPEATDTEVHDFLVSCQ